jgi:hypothetical protein
MSSALIPGIRRQDTITIGETEVPVLDFEIADGRNRKELLPGIRRVNWRAFSNTGSRLTVGGALEIEHEIELIQFDLVLIWSVSRETWVVDSVLFKPTGRKRPGPRKR